MITVSLFLTVSEIATKTRVNEKTLVTGSCQFPQAKEIATLPFRVIGLAADALSGAGVGSTGVAQGYIDTRKRDDGRKVEFLVIQNFVPTAIASNS